MKTRPYTPPPGFYDLPYTYAFNAASLTNGNNYQNQQVYIQGGYGDFLMRRVVGLNRILAPNSTGQFQIMRASQGVYQSASPIMAPNSPELAVVPEEFYPETGQIGFDLYGILLPTNPIAAQLAFQGVRRLKGEGASHRPSYNNDPKTYTYVTGVTLPGSNTGFVSSYTQIDNYDFELYQVMLFAKNASGLFVKISSPVCTVQIYDQFTVGISNIPILDIFYNGAPGTPFENGAIVPPLFYKKDTQVQIDYHGLSASQGYNFSVPQTIPVDEAGVGADGPYLFIGNQAVSPETVLVYKNNGTGTYTLLQTLNSPSGNDFIVNPGCYDDSTGYLVLGCANECFLYKVVAGLFTLQSTYNPGGPNALVGGTHVQISGTNVVLLGEDFATSQLVCKYLSVSTGAFVQLQSFNQAVDVGRGNFLDGTAYFSGTHFVLNNIVSNNMKCFELSGGAFSLIQTIAGVQFCNVLSLGYLFTVSEPATSVNYISVFSFSGTWTLSQTINLPVFPGGLIAAAAYSFISSTLGAPILLITGTYTVDNPVVVASLVGGTWEIIQTANIGALVPAGVDNQGLVGAQGAIMVPDVGDQKVIIFEAAGPPEVVAYLVGKKLYPCG
jgi:hypothetical protein